MADLTGSLLGNGHRSLIVMLSRCSERLLQAPIDTREEFLVFIELDTYQLRRISVDSPEQ